MSTARNCLLTMKTHMEYRFRANLREILPDAQVINDTLSFFNRVEIIYFVKSRIVFFLTMIRYLFCF